MFFLNGQILSTFDWAR